MRIIIKAALIFLLLACAAFVPPAHAAGANDVIVLNYHDVGPGANPYTVTKERLAEHFSILRAKGYTVISLQQYLQARNGGAALPDKPVMITFDDGYVSFYKEIYPLLKQYNYPAVLAVVTAWQQSGSPRGVGELVTWDQMKEMQSSGLVTIASHSHDLHTMVPANAFGDSGQAACTLQYKNGGHETEEHYRKRILADLKTSQQVFQLRLGQPVKTLVWPYGEYSGLALECAREAGFEVFLNLGDDVIAANHRKVGIPRTIIMGNPDEKKFLEMMAGANKAKPLRMAQVDLDYLYDLSPLRFEGNIDDAINQLRLSKANTVVLQAFADGEGAGNIEQVYFYTTTGRVKADVFSHAASRFREAGFRVYAWMPTLAGQWLIADHPEDAVQAIEPRNAGWYRRASPFSPRVRDKLKQMFREFAAYNPIDGILFQDDLYLNDFEDVSPAAQKVFRERFRRDMTAEALKDPIIQREWAAIKAKALNDLTLELADEARVFRPQIMVARNIYATVILDPAAKTWMSQDYKEYLQHYDYVVIMAYPYMEKAANPQEWLRSLVRASLAEPGAAEKAVFKLQAYDWNAKKWLGSKVLSDQVKVLRENGALHIGYYPVNVFSVREGLPY